jgi:hypothetical protein
MLNPSISQLFYSDSVASPVVASGDTNEPTE